LKDVVADLAQSHGSKVEHILLVDSLSQYFAVDHLENKGQTGFIEVFLELGCLAS
jgi:hypothetical protein